MIVDEIVRLLQAVAALPDGTQIGVGIVAVLVIGGGIYALVELGKRLIEGIVSVVDKLVDGTVRIFNELGRALGRYPPEYMAEKRTVRRKEK